MDSTRPFWHMEQQDVEKPIRIKMQIKYDRLDPQLRTLRTFPYRFTRKSKTTQNHSSRCPQIVLH